MRGFVLSFEKNVSKALEKNNGILRLIPNWVPRPIGRPGKRLALNPDQYYYFGLNRGGITERWFSSTTQTGFEGSEGESISEIVCEGERYSFKEVVQNFGQKIIGEELWSEHGGWPVFSKFFDYKWMLPLHLHPRTCHAKKVGKKGKPESYYFPPQRNQVENEFPYTFFGLNPKVNRGDIKNCLKSWNTGNNHILEHSKAYRIKPGTGWYVPPGVLHAPGSLLTYEPQVASDCNAIFQSKVGEEFIPRDFLVGDVPEEKGDDLDYLVDLIDFEKNKDPNFKQNHYLEPIVDSEGKDYEDKWVIYGNSDFSAKELTVESGGEATINDEGAYGLITVQGTGKIGSLELETPKLVDINDLTRDEVFVTKQKAVEGVKFENNSSEPLVTLRYFGPDVSSPEVAKK